MNLEDSILKIVPETATYLHEVINGKDRTEYINIDEAHAKIRDLLAIIVAQQDAIRSISQSNITKGVIDETNSATLIDDLNDMTTSNEFLDFIQDLKLHINTRYPNLMGDISKESTEKLKEIISIYVESNQNKLRGFNIKKVLEYINNLFTGFGILTNYLIGNDDVEELQILDFDDIRIMAGHGKMYKIPEKFANPQELDAFVALLTRKATLEQPDAPQVNQSTPFVRLRIGTMRISIMGGGIAKRGNHPSGCGQSNCYSVVIRKQKESPMTINNLIEWGSTTDYSVTLLKYLMRYGVSVIGFGGTGTGKTSMLTVLMKEALPDDINIITIAETDEMSFRKLDMQPFVLNEDGSVKLDENGNKIKNPNYGSGINMVHMWELANPNIQIMGKPAFVGAVNASLTTTPEVIILQETKGGEVKDLMEEAFTGHQVITTMHVNETKFVPLRILLMYQQSGTNIPAPLILQQVPASFPVAIEFTRYRDGSRKISEISEIVEIDPVTQECKVKPFVKFRVTENEMITTAEGKTKLVTRGEFDVIYNPLKTRIYDIMLKKGLLKHEVEELSRLYQKYVIQDTVLRNKYETDYGYAIGG